MCLQTTCTCMCVCTCGRGSVWEREGERKIFMCLLMYMYRQHFSTLTWRARGGLGCTIWLSTAPRSTRTSIAAARLTHSSTTSQRAVSFWITSFLWVHLSPTYLIVLNLSLSSSLPPSLPLPLSPPPISPSRTLSSHQGISVHVLQEHSWQLHSPDSCHSVVLPEALLQPVSSGPAHPSREPQAPANVLKLSAQIRCPPITYVACRFRNLDKAIILFNSKSMSYMIVHVVRCLNIHVVGNFWLWRNLI